MKRSPITVGIVAIAAALVAISSNSVAIAAPGADKAKTSTVVFYAENRGIARVDDNANGALENGDIVLRQLALSSTRGGEVIGVAYSQAEIVAYNAQAKTDVRRVSIQTQLPGGDLISMGVSNLPVGAVLQPGWQETYAIVGGTGKYEGARGSEKLTVLEDGRTFKVVLTFVR
jgi:hypothetical protein